MQNKIKRNFLTSFAKNFCSYFNRHNSECWPLDKTCKILRGLACSHFRDAVLRGCDPSYPYAKNVSLYPKLLILYRQIDPGFNVVSDREARLCECGAELLYRQKVCQKCKKRKSQETSRKYRQKANSPVTSSGYFDACKPLSIKG